MLTRCINCDAYASHELPIEDKKCTTCNTAGWLEPLTIIEGKGLKNNYDVFFEMVDDFKLIAVAEPEYKYFYWIHFGMDQSLN